MSIPDITGLILGAGASYEYGMPLIWELTDELRRFLTSNRLEEFNSRWRTRNLGFSDPVIDFVCSLLENNLLHYEHIIGALEVEQRRANSTKLIQDFHGIKIWLLDLIYKLIYARQTKNFNFYGLGLNLSEGITKLISQSFPLWIFSLNHDTMVELMSIKYKIDIKSGFEEYREIFTAPLSKTFKKIQFDFISRESIRNNNFQFHKPGEIGINLIKIHGSLDIFAQGDELNLYKLKTSGIDSYSYIKNLISVNEHTNPFPDTKATNELIYTDANGDIQFLRKTLLSGMHKFSDKQSQTAPFEFLNLFSANINYCNTIIVIGYSFGDSHVNEILLKWLSFSSKRKVRIIDPNAKYPNNFLHLSTQISLERKTFFDFLTELNDKQPSISAKISRKFLHYQRKRLESKLKKKNW